MKTITYDDAVWKLVPIEPTEKMIVEGFESEPNDYFTDQNELERYKALSGCRQAAYRASKCWSAMLAVAPTPPAVEQAQPSGNPGELASAQDREDALTAAARDVLAERQRQISTEGWTPEHDDEHTDGEIARAAAAYALASIGWSATAASTWPWDLEWLKPSESERRDLEKAGALVLAEIERLDRAAARAAKGE